MEWSFKSLSNDLARARSHSRDQYIVVPEECAASVAHSGTNNWTFKARSYDFLNVLDKLCTPSSSEWGLLWASERARAWLCVCVCVCMLCQSIKRQKRWKAGYRCFISSSHQPSQPTSHVVHSSVSSLLFDILLVGRAYLPGRVGMQCCHRTRCRTADTNKFCAARASCFAAFLEGIN